MKFKGTKGPWQTVRSNRVIYVESKDHVLIAELDNIKTKGFEQATPSAVYHNAKLIESAYELLEFAIEMVRRYPNSPWIAEQGTEAIKKATE